MESMILVVAGFYAAVQGFFGYKLFKYLVALNGFLIFGVLSLFLGSSILSEAGMIILLALVFGALGGFLAFKLYKAGIFIQCYGAGMVVGMLALASKGLEAAAWQVLLPA